jgi:hypothetical protein
MSYFSRLVLIPAFSILLSLQLFGYEIAGGDPLKCPPNITISCCQDFNDTNITGHPGLINYVFNNYSYSDSVGIDECRIGKIRRTWTGYNEVGQFSCSQYILMERNDIFSGNIKWPKDWSGSCSDVIPYSEPDYDIGFCDQIAHTFKDDTFRFDENACVKILRYWKVIDWCVFKPNTNSTKGVWNYTQTFMILDKTAPTINSCTDRTVKALNTDCSADVTFTQSATDNNCGENSNLKWIYEIDIKNDCKIDTIITIYSNNPSVNHKNLPIGKHLIKWEVYDGCANVSTCTENITVKDGKPPTLVCYIFTSANLIQGDDSIRLPAKHFVKEAFDNCSPKSKLIFSFSPEKKDSFLTFDCDDIGVQFLRIYAIDEAGNSDFVYVLTRIQVNEPCTHHSISGLIASINGTPLKDFELSLAGAGRTYKIGKTDANGAFEIPYKENYLKPKLKFSAPLNSTTFIGEKDIILLKDYLLGKTDLNDMQKFAADLNYDGKISTSDLKLMRNYYLTREEFIEGSENAKFYIENAGGETSLKEIQYIEDFKNFLNIKCIIKGQLSTD